MIPRTMDSLKRHTSRSALSCWRYLLVHYLVKCEKQRMLRMHVALNMHIIYEIMSLVTPSLPALAVCACCYWSSMSNLNIKPWSIRRPLGGITPRLGRGCPGVVGRRLLLSEHKLEVVKRVCQNTNLKSKEFVRI